VQKRRVAWDICPSSTNFAVRTEKTHVVWCTCTHFLKRNEGFFRLFMEAGRVCIPHCAIHMREVALLFLQSHPVLLNFTHFLRYTSGAQFSWSEQKRLPLLHLHLPSIFYLSRCQFDFHFLPIHPFVDGQSAISPSLGSRQRQKCARTHSKICAQTQEYYYLNRNTTHYIDTLVSCKMRWTCARCV